MAADSTATHTANMNTSKIYSSSALSKQTIKLSTYDAYAPKIWVSKYIFWPLAEHNGIEDIVRVFTEGLARTISDLPVLAGRCATMPDNVKDVGVVVDEHSYVELKSLDLNAEGPSYKQLKNASFPFSGQLNALATQALSSPVYAGSPTFEAVVITLKGGIALLVSVNHLIADNTGLAEIERVWSCHARDVSTGTSQRRHAIADVDHERGVQRLFVPPEGLSGEFKSSYWDVLPFKKSRLQLRTAPDETGTHAIDGQSRDWSIWHIEVAKLAELKADCSSNIHDNQWISTWDAMMGLFWSRVASLNSESADTTHVAQAAFPMGIRSRTTPALHPQYMGNAWEPAMARTKLGGRTDAEAWTAAAKSLRQCSLSWKQERGETWLAATRSLPPDSALECKVRRFFDERNTFINDYSRTPSLTFDWGLLGVPDRIRYVLGAGEASGLAPYVVAYPRLADGSIEIATATSVAMRDALRDDVLIKKYATLTCERLSC